MHQFEQLRVYREGLDLVAATYALTASLPRNEQFGLSSQMQRAAVSVVANIAEGAGRSTDREFRRFVEIARGSAFELRAHIDVCVRQGFVTEHSAVEYRSKLKPVSDGLSGLWRRLNESSGR